MSVNFNSFDSLGQNGLAMMQKSLNMANDTASKLMSSGAGPMDIAEASMGMSEAKVGMAVGAFLVKSQEELMNTALQLFGVGTNYSGSF